MGDQADNLDKETVPFKIKSVPYILDVFAEKRRFVPVN